MIIQQIGFRANLCSQKIRVFIDVINSSTADVILFPGAGLESIEDLISALSEINNRHSIIIVEVSIPSKGKIEKGKKKDIKFVGRLFIIDLRISVQLPDSFGHQIFATSEQLQTDSKLLDDFFTEISLHRTFVLPDGRKATVLLCGETALLHCPRQNGKIQNAVFDYDSYKDQFRSMLDNTDIFFNPIHTIQGEQGVMRKRREYFSADRRYYFSTAALDENKGRLEGRSVQYALYDSSEFLEKRKEIFEEGYVSRYYEI